MRSPWYVVGSLAILSCDAFLKPNSYYCDANTACQNGQTCDVAHHLCGAATDPNAPVVTGLSQSAGSPAGGIALTLQGKNFVPGMQVYIDDKPASSSAFVSATALGFTLPKGQCAQVITVTARTADGQTVPGAATLRYKYTNLAFRTGNQTMVPGGMAVAAARMDGDLNVDLIVAGSGPGLQILNGNGQLNFTAPGALAIGGNYSDVVISDLNNDGKNDIIARSSGGAEIFQATVASPYACTKKTSSTVANSAFAISDLDQDGGKDLILFDSTALTLTAYFAGPALNYSLAKTIYTFPGRVSPAPPRSWSAAISMAMASRTSPPHCRAIATSWSPAVTRMKRSKRCRLRLPSPMPRTTNRQSYSQPCRSTPVTKTI